MELAAITWATELLDFVNHHREWAGWVIFVLSVGETTPIVSMFIFSTPFMVGLGALVSTGDMDFLPIFLGAFAGSVTGSTMAWWVGTRFGEGILSWKPLARRPDVVEKTHQAMSRWGVWAVGVSHIFAPLTSVIYLIAGVARVNFWRFQAANVPGAFLWAFLIPKSGEWGGDLAQLFWHWFSTAPQ